MLRRNKLPALVADPTLGDPVAARVLAQLEAGRWRDVAPVIADLPPVAREWVVYSASTVPGRATWLAAWVRARGGTSATPWLVRGVRRVNRAWRRLGTDPPDDITDPTWVAFYRALTDAEADLGRAAEVAPSDGVPWSFLVGTSRGLAAPLHRLCARMEEVEVRDRWLPLAHFEFIRALGPSWGGSHETMWEAARTATSGAPMGSPVHAVVPIAHLEAWRVIDDAEKADRYLDDGTVAAEIAEAAERSVARRAFGCTGSDALARHAFLVAWCVLGDLERAREQFDLLGPRVPGWPWDYLHPDPLLAYETQRDRALI